MSRAASSPVAPADQLTLAEVEPGICAIGTWKNVVVIVWWTSATGAATRRLERVTLLMRDQLSEKASHIHIVKNRAGLPDTEARASFVKIMREHGPRIANCAVVIGGTGFWASTMRSAITSMRFISPRSFEMRFHGKADEILSWLPQAHQQQTGVELRPLHLARLLDTAEAWITNGVPGSATDT